MAIAKEIGIEEKGMLGTEQITILPDMAIEASAGTEVKEANAVTVVRGGNEAIEIETENIAGRDDGPAHPTETAEALDSLVHLVGAGVEVEAATPAAKIITVAGISAIENESASMPEANGK
ncbi:hypothetical protein ABW19_dt0201866 [Dactylella cylindrospora]|nr:hypothetical protein ABW19_dt0201866 [Dactylella cylindrospora]